ncbi:alkaline phosphatase [Plakobranchus ocellatus]|uniref:Alkaline phosphatase n=1 Tax=Plakobranchus ocellatus TaxID=259542 RepID=A0AAV3ZPM9_9GAST|nr:alkaline phosphatase [Plakobranchus ocellatus]
MTGGGTRYEPLVAEDAQPLGKIRSLWISYKRRMMATIGAATVIVVFALGAAVVVTVSASGQEFDYSHEKDSTYWHNVAQSELEEALRDRQRGVAKNVILFLGDGMGPTTVTAGRIFAGQLKGRLGEETELSFDAFPYTGLSKTYNTDSQVTDSAASGTAYLTGVKTNQGMLGLTAKAVKGVCNSTKHTEVDSILRWSLRAGKSAGVVTTTRITHATPAASYSHTPDRGWESDSTVPESEKNCEDIASQLILKNKDINVILGGGRAAFYPVDYEDLHADAENETAYLRRSDGKNLIQEWQDDMKARKQSFKYVYDRSGLESVDAAQTDYLLGLFSQDHMMYEIGRNKEKEPSLAEMTAKAVQILKKNKNGFFLLVEGGRIDHAHHESMPGLALYDVVAFADAVEKATQLTSSTDTLIVVTADHSHTLALSGYASRGNNILGINKGKDGIFLMGEDQMPYTTLLYANGPGYMSPRENITDKDTTYPLYVSQSAVPLSMETHGGEDVAIYAQGPQSFLYSGVHEQNYIPMVMAYASCVGPYKDGAAKKCARHEKPQISPEINPVCDSGAIPMVSLTLMGLCLLMKNRVIHYLIH